jgi:lysine 2,3-aminomutase
MKKTWQDYLKKNFKDIDLFIKYLKLDKTKQTLILKDPKFPINIPYFFAKKIKKNCLDDPILKQFLPLKKELKYKKNYLLDPLCETKFKNKNLLQKYSKRALLLTTNNCGMNCRFCFRKNLDFSPSNLKEELHLLKENKTISEIILSGGDPLLLSNNKLKDLLHEIDNIPHIKRIRFHTRILTALPQRIDLEFLKILKKINKQIIFALHINHPNEILENLFFYLEKIQKLKIPVLTQTVFLKGINDDANVLCSLFSKLIDHGILPYYIFQLDKVQGANHFEIPTSKGKKIMKKLKENLPGYAVPRYAQELPFKKNKTIII